MIATDNWQHAKKKDVNRTGPILRFLGEIETIECLSVSLERDLF